MKLHVKLDAKTGFPCVGLPDSPGYFVALLPVTKIQVEQFICEADVSLGWPMAELYGHVCELDSDDFSFTDTCRFNGEESKKLTDLFQRTALSEENAPEAILASNIPFATQNFEGAAKEFPSTGTPGASILAWLGARPSLPTEEEYCRIRKEYYCCKSGAYLETIRDRLENSLAPRRVLRIFRQLLKDERLASQRGLPFLEGGLWELTGQATTMSVYAGANPGRHLRPQAIGVSPYLSRFYEQEAGVRRVLVPHHPCIAMRPVFPEASLRPTNR